MHDEMLERRLRATLLEDARQLPFTITAAELERRSALRSRSLGSRRLGLLLAAAVGIGLFGIGGALGGLFDGPTPSPDPSPVAEATGPLPTASASPATLPTLDKLIAAGPTADVILAQGHGPVDGPPEAISGVPVRASSVSLQMPSGRGDYTITLACLGADGDGTAVLHLVGRFPAPVAPMRCDGTIHETVVATEPRELSLAFRDPSSWRLVVRRTSGIVPPPTPPAAPAILTYDDQLEDELANVVDETTEGGAAVPGSQDVLLRQVHSLPGRESYVALVSCIGGSSIRYIIGDEVDGVLVRDTETQVACDGEAHRGGLAIGRPFGSQVFVAADPAIRWSLLVTGAPPPVALVQELPGWQLSTGFGPELSFDTSEHHFTGPGQDGGGQVLIVLACAGSESLEVTVNVERRLGQVLESEHLVATCTPDGATTSQTFDTKRSYVDVSYTAPAGSWTAMSIMVPDPLPSTD